MKSEMEKKLKELLFYAAEREYKGICLDKGWVYGDCGTGAPAERVRKRENQDRYVFSDK